MISQYKTALQLAKFLNQVTMEHEALAKYIEDYAEYYWFQRNLEMIADLKNEYQQSKLGISVNQTESNEENDDNGNSATNVYSIVGSRAYSKNGRVQSAS